MSSSSSAKSITRSTTACASQLAALRHGRRRVPHRSSPSVAAAASAAVPARARPASRRAVGPAEVATPTKEEEEAEEVEEEEAEEVEEEEEAEVEVEEEAVAAAAAAAAHLPAARELARLSRPASWVKQTRPQSGLGQLGLGPAPGLA